MWKIWMHEAIKVNGNILMAWGREELGSCFATEKPLMPGAVLGRWQAEEQLGQSRELVLGTNVGPKEGPAAHWGWNRSLAPLKGDPELCPVGLQAWSKQRCFVIAGLVQGLGLRHEVWRGPQQQHLQTSCHTGGAQAEHNSPSSGTFWLLTAFF